MSRNRLRWISRIATALLVCALLLLGNEAIAQDAGSGYPDEQQPVVGLTDAEEDLNDTFPKRDSVFGFGVPQKYFDWKEDLYNKIGLKLGVSYQMLFQHAPDTATLGNLNTALGHWWGVTAKWTPLNRGEDFEGSLVLVAAERGSVGDNAIPAEFGALNVGSAWATNFEFTSWPFAVEELYWEQWFKDRLMIRAGNTAAATVLNTFRFKDARTSFTSTPFAFHESIPAPAQGPGFAAKWWPIEDSEFYAVGVLNDVNGNPNVGWAGLDWGSFTKGEYFSGVELGYVWRRDDAEFDHLFLDLFHADARSTRDPDTLPNEAGGGFKVMGSKQRGPWVGFGSYTYNTAEGGSTSVTFGRQTVTAGGVYLSPLGIRGEVGMGMIWMQPHRDLLPGVTLRNQTGFEAYWRILLTPNLWITPGIQVVFDPSANPDVDVVAIPHIKFRVAY